MKLEIDFREPTTEEICHAIAQQLVRDRYDGDETRLGRELGGYLDEKITELAQVLVREQFDRTVKERIKATVDEVIAEGWVQTDNYGNPRGERIGLKARISDFLLKAASERYNEPALTYVERVARDVIEKALRENFGKELAAAQAKFREQVDNVIAAKLAETLKQSLGLR